MLILIKYESDIISYIYKNNYQQQLLYCFAVKRIIENVLYILHVHKCQ